MFYTVSFHNMIASSLLAKEG